MNKKYCITLCSSLALCMSSCTPDDLAALADNLPYNLPGPHPNLPVNLPYRDLVRMVLRGIAATNAQKQEAARRSAEASSAAERKHVRYAAVKVRKSSSDTVKGDRVMIIDSKSGKPKDDKTYAVEDGASRGETKRIGGVETTVVDNIQGL